MTPPPIPNGLGTAPNKRTEPAENEKGLGRTGAEVGVKPTKTIICIKAEAGKYKDEGKAEACKPENR